MISLAEQCETGVVSAAQEWSDWIEWKGGECPIPDAKAREVQVRWQGCVHPHDLQSAAKVYGWDLTDVYCAIVAYRTIKSAQPTKDVTGDLPWYPPQQEGYSEWIAHDGNGCPVGGRSKTLQVLFSDRLRGDFKPGEFVTDHPEGYGSSWTGGDHSIAWHIVAYCIKLDQPAKSEEPAKVYLDGKWGVDFCAEAVADGTASNYEMCKRDREGAKPTRMRPNIPGTPADLAAILAMCDHLDRMGRDEDFAAATMVDPVFDHRFGRWGA